LLPVRGKQNGRGTLRGSEDAGPKEGSERVFDAQREKGRTSSDAHAGRRGGEHRGGGETRGRGSYLSRGVGEEMRYGGDWAEE